MVVLEVYSKCFTIKYKAYLFSKGTIFTLLTQVASIVAPFLIAFHTKGFWIKHDIFYEQPEVKFKGEYIINVITNNASSPILCSNLPFLQRFKDFDSCSLLKVIEVDKNNDGRMDELQFDTIIEVNNLQVQTLHLILLLEYSIKANCLMKMQSAAVVQENIFFGRNKIDVDAQLGLLQFRPIFCHPHRTNQEYNFPCVTENANEKYDIKNIIQNYSLRNMSTFLMNKHISHTKDNNNNLEFLINLRIQYPVHAVYYIVGFWQEMKWAWIQFLSLYIIFFWIRKKLITYLFENKLFSFYELSPLKKES
ncbi:hypothetical protein FQA39_LY13735 [Lamprigera yunnana]|nr:hypothetical protein FQA39_LY13735 [Lamprigera yunnana]